MWREADGYFDVIFLKWKFEFLKREPKNIFLKIVKERAKFFFDISISLLEEDQGVDTSKKTIEILTYFQKKTFKSLKLFFHIIIAYNKSKIYFQKQKKFSSDFFSDPSRRAWQNFQSTLILEFISVQLFTHT